jgi:hypothetical protein
MQDRHQTQRKKTFFGARVVFNFRDSTVDCLVRNMGDRGAKLAFAYTIGLPDGFAQLFVGE